MSDRAFVLATWNAAEQRWWSFAVSSDLEKITSMAMQLGACGIISCRLIRVFEADAADDAAVCRALDGLPPLDHEEVFWSFFNAASDAAGVMAVSAVTSELEAKYSAIEGRRVKRRGETLN